VNKHLYLCHPLVLSSPTLMMHGHMNLKVSGLFPQRVKRPGREAENSNISSAEVKNEWSYTSTPLHALMAWQVTTVPFVMSLN